MTRTRQLTIIQVVVLFILFTIGCGGDDNPSQPEPSCEKPILTLGPNVEVDTLQVVLTFGTDVPTRGRVNYIFNDQGYSMVSSTDTLHTFIFNRLDYGNTQKFEYSFIHNLNCPLRGNGEFVNPRHPSEDVEEGWQRYDEGNYGEAEIMFDLAVNKDDSFCPGRVGRGWTRLALANYAGARDDFLAARYLSNCEYDPDTHAGIALALSALSSGGSFLSDRFRAEFYAQEVLSNDPEWVFRHNDHFDFRDMILVLSQVYFFKGEYGLCLQWLQEFDPGISLDPMTDEGIAQLAERLEYFSNLYG